ncbi:MAG: Electron transport complex subunit RsxG [Candidatus Dichloromethanomonas elyunquensis]|nr:MAG: Electron transport complex subunit RsxG [Candidatus Dichloromethanomonas elyunquensis]
MVKYFKNLLFKFLPLAAFLILLITVVYQNFSPKQDVLNNLQQVWPETTVYEKITGKQVVYKAYKLTGNNKELLGYGAVASSSGYSGPITVMVGINSYGKIVKTILLEQFETPLFLQRVIAHDYLGSFKGKSVLDPINLNEDVDRVTGATYSSKGIANAVKKAAHWVGQSELGIEVTEQTQPVFHVEEVILIGLYILTFLSIWKKSAKLRWLIIVLSVGFLGFWEKYPITFANFTTLFSGNAPPFLENPFWHLLVVVVLLGTLLSGRNFYCHYLCPFGGIQEGLNKIGGVRCKVCPGQSAKARKIRLPLAWLAFMVALLFHNHSIASYEPFSALFQLQGNKGQWLLMPFVLFTSVFIYRFWCHFFCPVGAVLDLSASVKRRVLKIWKKKNGEKPVSQ